MGGIGPMVHGFDKARVCLNGHVLDDQLIEHPQPPMPFCPTCGAATAETCETCGKQLNGQYRDPERGILRHQGEVDGFCPYCGATYPWTQSALKAAEDLANLLDMVNEADRQTLIDAFPDLIRDAPSATSAAYKVRLVLAKTTAVAGEQVFDAFKNILYGVVATKVGPIIWP